MKLRIRAKRDKRELAEARRRIADARQALTYDLSLLYFPQECDQRLWHANMAAWKALSV